MRIPVRTPYATPPLVSDCALKHHRPGRRVRFSEWDTGRRAVVKYSGRVIDHEAPGRRITIAVDPDGRHFTTECGHVAAAP